MRRKSVEKASVFRSVYRRPGIVANRARGSSLVGYSNVEQIEHNFPKLVNSTKQASCSMVSVTQTITCFNCTNYINCLLSHIEISPCLVSVDIFSRFFSTPIWAEGFRRVLLVSPM